MTHGGEFFSAAIGGDGGGLRAAGLLGSGRHPASSPEKSIVLLLEVEGTLIIVVCVLYFVIPSTCC